MGKLTVKFVESVRATGKKAAYGDGEALELHVEPSKRKGCTKKWIARFRWEGKANNKTLGTLPDTSLAEARQLNAAFRAHLDQGLHPALFVPPKMARKAKAQKRNPDAPAPPDSPQHWTVKQYVEKWLKSDPNWSKNTVKTKSDRAHKYIVKPYGHMKLRDITHAVIEDCIRLLTEEEKHAQAKKVAGVWKQLYEYAELHDKSLPNVAQNLGRYRKKRVKAKHHPTLVEPADIGDFVVRLEDYKPKYKGTKALPYTIHGLWLVLYTMKRPHEVCEGKWAEIDFEQKLWRKDAENTKTGVENDECPLCEQALKVLTELHKITGDFEYMFPGGAGNRHIVPETLRKLILEGLGYSVGELTTHGLRGMFSTTGNELGYNFAAVEKQLSHNIGNEVSQAYNHAKYLRMRRQVVQKYADWLHVQANKVRKKKMQASIDHDGPEQANGIAV
ncbi:MAG: Prophage integrase IntS [Desulfovibrio sp.]